MNAYLDTTLLGIRIIDIIIAVLIFFGFLLLRSVFSKTILKMLKAFAARTKSTVDDKLVNTLEAPLDFSFILMGIYLAKQWLAIERFDAIFDNILSSLGAFIVFWILFRLIHEFNSIFTVFSSRFGKELSSDIENFIVKSLKVLIIILGVMTILQEWGINVSAFVASLGLGGLAFALAAKDTAANLFGSLVLFSDRPFKIGDWVQTGDAEGVIEDIGIRSTKIRTFSQALVTIPNATMANTAITNWTRMGKRRIKMRLGLTYGTSTAQMENVLREIRDLLHHHPEIHENPMIYFDEFADSALSIFCYFFTKTTVWADYLRVRETINLEIMKIVEKHGASFAFPSQSLYIESMPSELKQGN